MHYHVGYRVQRKLASWQVVCAPGGCGLCISNRADARVKIDTIKHMKIEGKKKGSFTVQAHSKPTKANRCSLPVEKEVQLPEISDAKQLAVQLAQK
jgi:hypothetical protein